jgi:YVTN family beta-propeller protein
MNGDGREGPARMSDQRTEGDVGPILQAWMAAVAPPRAPERMLEESFARTMVAGQVRVYPWDVVRRDRRGGPATRGIAGIALTGVAAALAIAVTVGLVFRPGQSISGGPSLAPSSSPSPSLPRPASEAPFPSPVVVQPTATIPVTGAVALATDGTSIWLFTATGELKRIDPATNAVAASVVLKPATAAYQSLAGDNAGVWVTDFDAGKVLRFDPQTLRATASIALGSNDLGSPKGVLVTKTAIWVADVRGGSVVRIDPKTNKVVATVAVGPTGPSGPNWLAEGSGSIWVGVPNAGSVIRINEKTNAIEATIRIVSLASPCGGLAAGSTAVWITSCDGSSLVTQIDPATNTGVGTIDIGGNGYTFALVADRPWVSPINGQIVRLDPVNHAVDRVVGPGPGFSGGGDVVVAAGSLWVNDWASNRILRLPIAAFGG